MTQGPGQQNDEGFRADLYGDEELVPFDVRDYSGRRAMRLLFVVFVLLILAAFAGFKVYSKGLRDRNDPPLIKADTTPYKVLPENPGGEETPNQDKTVYDVMNGTAKTETVTPVPQPEEPITIPRTATIVLEDEPASKPAEIKPQVKPQPKPEVTTPKPQTQQPVQVNGGDYVVQVASVRTREDAEALWYALKSKFARDLPSGSYADVRRADLGDKGIYYRLRIAGLTNKDAAANLCTRFKAGQQACFVTRK